MTSLWNCWYNIVVSPCGFLAGTTLIALVYWVARLWVMRARRSGCVPALPARVCSAVSNLTPEQTALVDRAEKRYRAVCEELRKRLCAEGLSSTFILGAPGFDFGDGCVGIERVEDRDPRIEFNNPDDAGALEQFYDQAGEDALYRGALRATHFRVVGCDCYGTLFVLFWFSDGRDAESPVIEFAENWSTPLPVYFGSELEQGIMKPCGDLRQYYGVATGT